MTQKNFKAAESASVSSQASTEAASIPWAADVGDGNYRNPVLYADYSDPDVVRVGDDFWMTSSSFGHVPGLPILHSRDLVNWTLLNHALPRLVPHEHFSTPRHGQGVWAPSIRFHAGKYWIFFPDPDFGIYFVTAEDPRKAWSEPVLVKGGKGLIDPCPLWDDDGKVYLIHGWARSRSGICNLLTLHELSADAKRVIDPGKIIIDGAQLPGWKTIEGPKLHKHGGWYYVFAPAGGVAEGYQAVFRSRKIEGPYENRVVLAQGSSPVNGPHQGAWVETGAGEHWFFHFQEISAYGRVVHMQPMRWREDGWPVMGADPDGDGTGEPVLLHQKPALPAQPLAVPAMSDEFDGETLGLQWQWQANPRAEWASLRDVPGSLRLHCIPAPIADSHWLSPNLLMQKFPAPTFMASTVLRFTAKNEGDAAGLIVFGYDYAWLGLERTMTGDRLVMKTCAQAQKDGKETVVAEVPAPATDCILRVVVADGARCSFSYSTDGSSFRVIGPEFRATSSMWVGAKAGLFASARPGSASAGHADYDWFRIGK